jgi:hypothetical protein
MRWTGRLLALLAGIGLLATPGHAAPYTQLRVALSPNKPGHRTNISFNISITGASGQLPPPLTGLDIRYPNTLGFASSGLGLATCPQRTLELAGVTACPHNSWMGRGQALAEVPFGPETIAETATVAIVRAPATNGSIAMFLEVEAWRPVITYLVLPGELQPGPGSNETIHVAVPLVESLPGGPDVAVVQLQANIGPRGLVYYERAHQHYVPYHPEGIPLPPRCPPRGFHFTAALAFQDGSQSTSTTTVHCPTTHR